MITKLIYLLFSSTWEQRQDKKLTRFFNRFRPGTPQNEGVGLSSLHSHKLFNNFSKSPQLKKIFSPRWFWEMDRGVRGGYNFSDDELNKASKRNDKFIGERKGIECYLSGIINNFLTNKKG